MRPNEGEYLFIYNSNSITDRRAKSYISAMDEVKVNQRDIYKDPLTPTQIAEVAQLLNVPIRELYSEDGDSSNAYSEDELVFMMAKKPEKLTTPIVLCHQNSFIVGSTYELIKENVQPYASEGHSRH